MLPLNVTLIALPLGNVSDLSPRAKEGLEMATHIFCEDSRKLQDLAHRVQLALKAQITSLPGNSEQDMDWEKLFKKSDLTQSWVLVSDAGTPVVNDPGWSLIEFCRQKQINVSAIPGPSAPVLAWQWSGGFGLPFVFAGFAPKAKSSKTQILKDFFSPAEGASTFCFFDTRHQILTTLEHLSESGWGTSKLFIAREMTKAFEELISGRVDETLALLTKRLKKEEPLGEMTLLLEGRHQQIPTAFTLEELISLREGPPKAAAKLIAQKIQGASASDIYKLLQKGVRDS